ncbi:hypothetical protein JTB14_020455 [Gonioctena quinquepunctata]|nr:hypothetical protein JTB14_020455 [Gonioctena quinquepunctata]
MESDGISIISEGSHLNESNEEECFQCEKDTHFTNEPIIWTLSDSETRVPVPVFVYPNHPPEEIYSNYMKDLVQEIAEHELGSIQSDQESNEIASISKPRIDNLGKNALSKLKKENMENKKAPKILNSDNIFRKQNKVQIHKRNKKRNNEQNYNEKSSKDYWRNKKSKVKEYDSTEGLKGHYDKIKMKYFKNLPKNKFVEQKNKLDKTSGTKKRSYDQDSEERRRADHKNSLISS